METINRQYLQPHTKTCITINKRERVRPNYKPVYETDRTPCMRVQAFTDHHHHQFSSAPITIIPQVHYNVNADAVNRSQRAKNQQVDNAVLKSVF